MRRPWRLHPQLLLLQNQKWKQCKFLVFKEIFLERRGFSRVVNFLPRHLVSVAASGFSGSSVAVCTRPTTLLFSSSCSSLKGWGSCSTAEFIVGLTLKSLLACLTLQSALLSLSLLLGFDICHARGTLSSPLVLSAATTAAVSCIVCIFAHTKRAFAATLCERIFFFNVASTAFPTWQACDFSQRHTIQKKAE